MIDPLAARSADYYTRKLKEFGATPKGADWNSLDSQQLRFQQLLRLCDGEAELSVNDYGCGYGALVDYLRADGRRYDYGGYDASAAMIEAARERCRGDAACRFTAELGALAARQYTVASGVFNVMAQTPAGEWWAYIVRSLDEIAAASTDGFAANFLTSYSDPPKQRPDLFYADPSDVLRHCMTRYGRRAALLHDYPLYEFTILVRL